MPTLPLIIVRFDGGDLDTAAIGQAADLARARRPDARFEVVASLAPGAGVAAAAGKSDAERVADALAAAGVARDHIVLGLRADAGAAAREVRVYVR